MNYKEFDIIVGIDPGVTTGVSVWFVEEKKLTECMSLTHHQAVSYVHALVKGNKVLVRFEDARLRTWFGKSGREQLQGAGSIKRDCQLWEEWLTSTKIPFEVVAPRNNKTKLDAITFNKITGWDRKSNEHARDSAMLVVGL